MSEIDQQSQQFISWAYKKISDKAYVNSLVEEVAGRFYYYMDMPTYTLSRIIKKKLEAGSLEHKTLKTKKVEIDRELKMEFQDLIGWLLMEKYLEEIKK